MWRKSRDARFSRLMMAGFPRSTLRMRSSATPNVQRSTLNAQWNSEALNSQLSNSPARRPFCVRCPHAVTQLAYARQGIITPEMEFIAIRENLGREILGSAGASPAPSAPRRMARKSRATICTSVMPAPSQSAIGNRQLEIPSLPNSSAPKSRAVAPSFPQTSIIPNPSR